MPLFFVFPTDDSLATAFSFTVDVLLFVYFPCVPLFRCGYVFCFIKAKMDDGTGVLLYDTIFLAFLADDESNILELAGWLVGDFWLFLLVCLLGVRWVCGLYGISG